MCVSVAPADFDNTVVYLGVTNHPITGKLIHVLGYQNEAQSHAGPNAMLIHVPAKAPMTDANMINTTGMNNILNDMVKAVDDRPISKGLRSVDLLSARSADDVLVFDHGIYRVAMTHNASLIPEAVRTRFPENKRPRLDPNMFEFYDRYARGNVFLLFGFDNADKKKSEPVMVWYEPHEPTKFRFPALDCHTGDVPQLYGNVIVNHWLIASVPQMEAGKPVTYRGNLSPATIPFLPSKVVGRRFVGAMPQGDFTIHQDDVAHGNMNNVQRELPAVFA